MSHSKERSEQICLNCNAHVYGKYCHLCGQENVEPKETFWGLVTHFVYDVVHFDGKFFSTLKYLLLKPGFLSHEYLRGKRASYLHPIRMYVFTSAIFFIIFFTFISKPEEDSIIKESEIALQKAVQSEIDGLQLELASQGDSTKKEIIQKKINRLQTQLKNDSTDNQFKTDSSKITELKPKFTFDNQAKTIAEYDSLQNLLPAEKRNNWLMNYLQKRSIALNIAYKNNPETFWGKFKENLFHSIPQMMFVSLPLIALILQLLYIRRRKEIFYVNHVVFLIHVFIAFYILILVSYGFTFLGQISDWRVFSWLETLTGFAIFFYMYKAIRNFYEQGRFKTILKYFLLFFAFAFIITLVMAIFMFKSLLQI